MLFIEAALPGGHEQGGFYAVRKHCRSIATQGPLQPVAVILALTGAWLGLAAVPTTRALASMSLTAPRAGLEAMPAAVDQKAAGRVIEVIPSRYQKRYSKWKNEFLSTAVGRSQWDRYALDTSFTLTITVSHQQAQGALVDDYRWDDSGKLVAATIFLGDRLDSGYPNSINYPITCSLAPGNLPPEVRGTILAATKIAHEFGHLNRTMNMDGSQFRLQNRLMIEYNEIFNTNGHDVLDPRLLALEKAMDGTPVSIAQDRESWAEVGAIRYLQERLGRDHHAKMPQPVRQAIEAYVITYPGRFK